MKNKNWILIAISITIFFVSPILVQYTNIIPGSKGNGDWLSFWGSYLGVIPSGLIAFAVAKYQIECDKTDQKDRDNHKQYVDNLSSVNAKLRKLDKVFEYGISQRYLMNDEFDKFEEIGVVKDEDLKNRMYTLSDYLYKLNIFSLLDELLLDIDMMPNVRGTDIQANIKSINVEMNTASSLFSDFFREIDRVDYGCAINTKVIKHYRNAYDLYHETLRIIAKRIYGN